MTIEEAIRSHLTATSALTALCGTRIYFWRSFQTESSANYPYIIYTRLGGDRIVVHSPVNPGIIESMFQFDVFGKTADSVRATERQLRRALETFPGTTGYSATRFRIAVPFDQFITEPESTYRASLTASTHHTDD